MQRLPNPHRDDLKFFMTEDFNNMQYLHVARRHSDYIGRYKVLFNNTITET